MSNFMNQEPRKKEILILVVAYFLLIAGYFAFEIHYSFNNDTWHYTFGTYKTIQEQLKSGVFPFWNNYEGSGMPLLLKGSIDLLFLPLLLFLSVKQYLVFVGFFYFLSGLYFMYLFLHDEGLEKSVALIGALAWSTNGFFLWYLHELALQSVLIFIPLVLLCLKRISQRNKAYWYWLLFVILNALQMSYGRWDLYEYSIWIVLLYVLLAVRQEDTKSIGLVSNEKVKLLGAAAAGVVFALILCAPFAIPYAKTIITSFRSTSGISANYLSFPDFFQHIFPNTGWLDSRISIPLFVFVFAMIALFDKKFSLKRFALALVILYCALAYPFRFYEIIRLLPLHKGNIQVFRMVVLFDFGLTILFSYGLQKVIKSLQREDVTIFIVFSVFLILLSFIYTGQRPLQSYHYYSLAFCLIPLAIYVFFKHSGQNRPKKINTLFLGYVALYLITFSFIFNYTDMNDGNLLTLEKDFTESLKNDFFIKLHNLTRETPSLVYRAVDVNLFHPAFLSLYSIETPNFYSPFPSQSIGKIVTNVLGNPICYSSLEKIDPDLENRAFYSLSSVKYVVYDRQNGEAIIWQGNSSLQPLFYNDKWFVFENKNCFERIRFIDDFIVEKDIDRSIMLLQNATQWFEKKYIVNIQPYDKKDLVQNDSEAPSYNILTNKPGYLKISVSSNKTTMMIISNAYNTDWHLKIDGKRDQLFLVNAFYQGVRIKQGDHVYEIYYLPNYWYGYIFLSALTLALLLLFPRCYKPKAASKAHRLDKSKKA